MNHRMKATALAVAGVALAATAAWATEKVGKVRTLERERREIVLEDGTTLSLVPGLSFDLLLPGATVKLVYDERDGKKWVKSVEATR